MLLAVADARTTLFKADLDFVATGTVTAADLNAQTTGGSWSLNTGRVANFTIQADIGNKALLLDDPDSSGNSGTISFASITFDSPGNFSPDTLNTVMVNFRTATRRTGANKALLYEFYGGPTVAASLEWADTDGGRLTLNGATGTSPFSFLGSWISSSSAVRDVSVSFSGGMVNVSFGGVVLSTPVLNSVTSVDRITVSSSNAGGGGEVGKARGVFLDDITVSLIPPIYQLQDFVYDPADGNARATIEGPPLTRYKLVTAADLDFGNPDINPLPPTAADSGSLDGNHVITDATGSATVHFNLGTDPANFLRAESLGPVTVEREIVVDVGDVLSNVSAKPGGLVTNWLLDSDIERPRDTPMVGVYQQLQVGSLRFPFGHLSNNYLWTSAPYDQAVNGLTPRVASRSRNPAFWNWAVHADGTFRKDLDFDEFIAQCGAADIEPVVVINVMGHKYPNAPTLAELREAAVEWVRYANVTRGYGVKYWQLGNEQDHHSELLPLAEYRDIYGDFSAAMKAVDPTIRTGAALINNRQWAKTLLEAYPDRVDFIGCHQYQWQGWDVEEWRETSHPLIPAVLGIEDKIRQSPRPDAEIMVTETSSFGNWFDGSGEPDIMRALCFAEMLLHMATVENLTYTHFWCTHSPWGGEDSDGGLSSAFTLQNELKPTAVVIKIVNQHLADRMVKADRLAGPLRTFATHDPEESQVTIFLVNKSDQPVAAELSINGLAPSEVVSRTVYAGTGYTDLNPKLTTDKQAILYGNRVFTSLPGISLTALTLK